MSEIMLLVFICEAYAGFRIKFWSDSHLFDVQYLKVNIKESEALVRKFYDTFL